MNMPSIADVVGASPEVTAQESQDLKHQQLLNEVGSIEPAIYKVAAEFAKYLDGKTSKVEIVNQLKTIGTPDALKVIPSIEALHETLKTHKNTDLTEVTSVMKQLLAEAKKIPKSNVEIPETKIPDYSKQFAGLTSAIKGVEKVVKAQKLIAKAPVVNVKQPNVVVAPPNLTPLQSGLTDIVEAVRAIIIPEYKTDTEEVQKLLQKSNKLLKDILDKPVSSGGGGGQAWTAVNPSGLPMPLNLDSDGNLKTSGSGGTVTNDGTFAKETGGNLATIADNTSKNGDAFTYYSQLLSAVDTITPTSGKAIRIYKVLVTNSSNNTTFRNVTLSSTSLGTFLQGEAIASSWRTTLATDEVLTITPAGGTVYVNIQYELV